MRAPVCLEPMLRVEMTREDDARRCSSGNSQGRPWESVTPCQHRHYYASGFNDRLSTVSNGRRHQSPSTTVIKAQGGMFHMQRHSVVTKQGLKFLFIDFPVNISVFGLFISLFTIVCSILKLLDVLLSLSHHHIDWAIFRQSYLFAITHYVTADLPETMTQ